MRKSFSSKLLVTLVVVDFLFLLSSSVLAQSSDPLITPPPNVVIPNANGVPVGPFGGLESGAYVARVDDSSAAWFNPAGLSRATSAQITGSAGLYQYTRVNPSSLENNSSTLRQIPNLVGFSMRATPNCTGGLAIVTSNSWTQETDSELILGTPAAGERFGYSADAEFSKRNVSLSAGCQRGRFRYGGGAAFSVTSLRLVDTVSDRVSSSTGLRTLLLSSRQSGSAFQFRPILGAQFDPSQSWRVGLVIRTPAATLYRSGKYATDGTLQNGATSEGLSIFDDEAEFSYKMPWEFQGGVAYIGKRAQAEFNVQQFTSVSSYTLLASNNPILTYSDAGQGGPPTIQSLPFAGLKSASNATTNYTVGGHYQLSADHSYELHAGFTTDHSPVATEDQVFEQIDLNSWTIGLSGKASKLQFAGGINFRRGESDEIRVRDLLNGQPVLTSLKIKTTAFIYSLSYQF
jgi:hypothetical protein